VQSLTTLFSKSDGREARGGSGSALEALDVVWPVPDRDNVRASWFDVGETRGLGTGYAIGLDGWLVGERAPLEAIEVGSQGACIWRLGINVHRPDVQALHADLEWSLVTGFHHAVSALKLPTEFEMEVGALLKDGSRTSIAMVRGRRRALSVPESKVNPIIVTTLGRTGSTWVLDLLGRHPGIVAFRPFEYEPKIVRYWTDILGALSEPASYRQALSAEIYGPDWWIGTVRQAPPTTAYDAEMERWLAGQNVEDLALMCKARIDGFYEQAAKSQRKPSPRYFAEKVLPGTFREQIVPELYPGSKEVFLLRDFRDMASSILEFDRKRTFEGFLRPKGATDEEFVRGDLRRDIGVLADSWRKRSGSAFLLRYEDLVHHPEPTLAGLLAYLELDHDDKTVHRMLRLAGAEVRHTQHQTSSSAVSSIGRWRNEEPTIRTACDEALGDLLETFGYSR
jgi:Sulfotransferase family